MSSNNDKDNFIRKLKNYINSDNHEYLTDKYYEWKIEEWNKIVKYSKDKKVDSPIFFAYGYKWMLHIYPNGKRRKNLEYVSVSLHQCNNDDDYSNHIPINIVFFVRNCNDYSRFHCAALPTSYFTSNHICWNHGVAIKKKELYVNNNSNKCIVENNKCVFGVYFQIFKYKEELYKREIINSLYDEKEKKDIIYDGFYEWKIENWDKMKSSRYSPEFYVGDYKWELKINRFTKNCGLYLACSNVEFGLSLCTKASVFIRNYYSPGCLTFFRLMDCDGYRYFKRNEFWGSDEFINEEKLLAKSKKTNKAIVENNKCIVGVYIQIYGDKKEFPYEGINHYHYIQFDDDNQKVEKIEKEEREDIINELRKKIEREENRNIENEIKQRIEREKRKKFELEIKQKIEKEVREKIEREESRNIENEIKKRIEREKREKFELEIKQKIEKEVREKIEREEREKIKKEIEEQIKNENSNKTLSQSLPQSLPQFPPQSPPQSPPPQFPLQSPPPQFQSQPQSLNYVQYQQYPSAFYATPIYYPPPPPNHNTLPLSPGQNPVSINPSVPISPNQTPVSVTPLSPNSNPTPIYYYPPQNTTNPNQTSIPVSPNQNGSQVYYYPSSNTTNTKQNPTSNQYCSAPNQATINNQDNIPSCPPPSYY